MSKAMEKFKDDFARTLFGMTKQEAIDKNICISCKKPPVFYTMAGDKEYAISGLCEPCFDGITRSDEDNE